MGSKHWGARFAGAIVAAGCAAAATAHGAQGWTLVDLGTLGGPGSYGAAVSDTGVVVGCADTAAGVAHAFVYEAGTMRDLGTGSDSPTGGSCALAVNNTGTIAGRSSTGELVTWKDGALARLGLHGDIGGINDAGAIAGTSSDGASSRAFLLRDGVLTPLGEAGSAAKAINGRNEVVGTSNGHAFLYSGGAVRDLGTLGGNGSGARGINSRGEVVGMSTDEFGAPTPFIYHGAMHALPAPSYASAIAINNRGQVVGSGEGVYGFLVEGDTVTRLGQLPAVVEKGWRRLEPTGINERGWIVGTATNADGNLRAFLLVPASEERSKPIRLRSR